MHRQAPRLDRDEIETTVETSEFRAACQKAFEAKGDPVALPRRNRVQRSVQRGSRLDLDRNDHRPPADNQIDLAGRRAHPPRQNAIAPQHQPQRGQPFGAQAPAFGGAATLELRGPVGPQVSRRIPATATAFT